MSASASKNLQRPDEKIRVQGCNDLLCARASGLYTYNPMQSDLNTGVYSARNWVFGNVLFAIASTDAAVISRSRAQLANGEHLLFVQRCVSGELYARSGDLDTQRKTGNTYLVDVAIPEDVIQMRLTQQYIFMPKSEVGFDASVHPAFLQCTGMPVLGELIDNQLDDIFNGLLNKGLLDVRTYQQLIACLKLALDPARDDYDARGQFRDAMMQRICSFIEGNLEHPELSVSSILANFGVSRASLYRMFDEKGGVRQYISDRRLNRAVQDLSNRPYVRGQLSAVALKWGFSSDANFNRSVRRQFGVAPGSLFQDIPHLSHQECVEPDLVHSLGLEQSE